TTTATKLPEKICDRCENLGVLSLPNIRMDEEQEQGVSCGIEGPPKVSPATHFLHPDGVVPPPS
ncbi:hypothetical protein EV363DRAFT_1162232, partial [Boletus edulis]